MWDVFVQRRTGCCMGGHMAGQASTQNRTALPLAGAAAVLGLTTEALRKRWKRGKIDGYRGAGGRVFIYVQKDGQMPGQASGTAYAGQADSETGEAGLHASELAVVVELQRTELDRLLNSNHRLEERVDTLIKQNENEQVLRRQMQATLDRLTERQALPAPPDENAQLKRRLDENENTLGMLKQGVMALIGYIEGQKHAR